MDHEERPGGAEGETQLRRPRLSRRLLAVAVLVAGTAIAAQDEHQRRLGAELLVLGGDARRLAAGNLPEPRQQGLRSRLKGALSSLSLLARRAGDPDTAYVPRLRAALASNDWPALERELARQRRRHPLELTSFATGGGPDVLRLGEAIHRQACAGCHDAPAPAVALPAEDLFRLARILPREEFIARLLNGVRGDTATSYRNPFSDAEIGALAAFYASGMGGASAPGDPGR